MTAFLPTALLAVSSAVPTPTTGSSEQLMPGVGESTLRPGLDQSDVTPGIEGFLFTALMVAMVIVVMRLMVRSVRRVQYRSMEAEDMLVERYQGYLPEEETRHRAGDDPQVRTASDVQRLEATLQKKYPGYLDGEAPEPRSPDSGRD